MKTTMNNLTFPRSRRSQAGQSAIIAVIVLFLLLFLGAIFIALVANNLKGTQRAANVSASGRYAEAGINYLDQQLTTSPEGADWRPIPDSLVTTQSTDPDYFWLQAYHYDTQRSAWVGGYTRINFGGPTPGSVGPSGTSGGRSLVRLTYRPDPPVNTTTGVDSPVVDPTGAVVSPTTALAPQPINKYLKLESIGRSGQVVTSDPTTYGNSEPIGLRVEQVAYKAIGINEYIIQATNKDHKPVDASLGDVSMVIDRGKKRNVETVIEGPVRFNTDLTLYGVNRFLLDPTRNDTIEVSGAIHLSGLSDTASRASLTNADPTRVYVNVAPGANDIGNVVPSASPDFTTSYAASLTNTTLVAGILRDNPRGSDTQGLPLETDAAGNRTGANQNLRAVGRTDPPLIDAPIGPNGLTRYRAVTLDSAPLSPQYVAANDVNNSTSGLGSYSSQYGWGQGMYIANTNHIQAESQALVGGQSLRSAWLNRDPNNPPPYWRNDLKYDPPAVTVILTPRYMILRRPADDVKQGTRGYYFRAPYTTGNYTAGQRLPDEQIIRYTDSTKLSTSDPSGHNAPFLGIPGGTTEYEGYPATVPTTGTNHTASYTGDFVIYAEGNIRIRGVAGGLDPETQAYFERHLTVISGGGNVYIDGNLLRDNVDPNDGSIGAKEVRGRSTIALLAKNSVVVNTTQFLAPSDSGQAEHEQGLDQAPFTRVLNVTQPELTFHLSYGPEDSSNTPPNYITRTSLPSGTTVPKPILFLRHGPSASKDTNVFVQLTLNQPSAASTTLSNGATQTSYNYLPFTFDPVNPATYDPTTATLTYADPSDATTLLLQSANYTPSTGSTTLPALTDQTFVIPPTFLFGGVTGTKYQYPYTGTGSSLVSLVGTDNLLRIEYETNSIDGPSSANYQNTRVGVAPLDVRIEALMYAQEGTFFIIPGPWFNPDPNDTYERFVAGEPNSDATQATPGGRRAGENTASAATALPRVSHLWPFYHEPMDIRMTFYGAISENLPAEIGDQSAWLEKWGWVPDYYGSTGLTGDPNFPTPPATVQTVHGRYGYLRYPPDSPLGSKTTVATTAAAGGSGIYYQFDNRAISPYALAAGSTTNYSPLRPNPYFPDQPLPLTPKLPVAPGLLYYGQNTDLPQ